VESEATSSGAEEEARSEIVGASAVISEGELSTRDVPPFMEVGERGEEVSAREEVCAEMRTGPLGEVRVREFPPLSVAPSPVLTPSQGPTATVDNLPPLYREVAVEPESSKMEDAAAMEAPPKRETVLPPCTTTSDVLEARDTSPSETSAREAEP